MVTFQFIPYHDVETLTAAKRVNKLLNIVKDDRIVIMEGRLKKEEEADLIEITMEEIDAKFKERQAKENVVNLSLDTFF